jgi:hypothetical protein
MNKCIRREQCTLSPIFPTGFSGVLTRHVLVAILPKEECYKLSTMKMNWIIA